MRLRDKGTLINRVYVPAVTVEYHYVCLCVYCAASFIFICLPCVDIAFAFGPATATLNKLGNRSGITIRFFFILLLC